MTSQQPLEPAWRKLCSQALRVSAVGEPGAACRALPASPALLSGAQGDAGPDRTLPSTNLPRSVAAAAFLQDPAAQSLGRCLSRDGHGGAGGSRAAHPAWDTAAAKGALLGPRPL